MNSSDDGSKVRLSPTKPCRTRVGIRNGTIGAVHLPKILVLTIDDFVSAQGVELAYCSFEVGSSDAKRDVSLRLTASSSSSLVTSLQLTAPEVAKAAAEAAAEAAPAAAEPEPELALTPVARLAPFTFSRFRTRITACCVRSEARQQALI